MHPAIIGIISGVFVLVIGELIRLLIRSLQSSTFTDEERRYIDDRIMHKLNNYSLIADAKFQHKKTPRLE